MAVGMCDCRREKIIRAIIRETRCAIAFAVRLLFDRRPELNASERKIIEDTTASIEGMLRGAQTKQT